MTEELRAVIAEMRAWGEDDDTPGWVMGDLANRLDAVASAIEGRVLPSYAEVTATAAAESREELEARAERVQAFITRMATSDWACVDPVKAEEDSSS